MTWTRRLANIGLAMTTPRALCLLPALSLVVPALAQQAADLAPPTQDISVSHVDCTFFGSRRDEYVPTTAGEDLAAMTARSTLTTVVTAALGATRPPARSRTAGRPVLSGDGDSIDDFIFSAMRAGGIAPAAASEDAEFLRRVTLDLTGRIPTPDEVFAFLGDESPEKRNTAIDRLLVTPQWADRWAMFFGDRFGNTISTSQVNRFIDGRDAFHLFLLESLRDDKPYDQLAREILTSAGNAGGRAFPEFSNLEDAEAAQRDYETYPVTGTPAGYIVGALTTGGPIHDTWDAMAVDTATDFLGIAHMDCLLCHDGAGHLDSLSLWGEQAKRSEAWGLAAFFSRTAFTRPRIRTTDGSRPYPLRYWVVFDRPRGGAYGLDTTTGNRPERQPQANGGLPFVTPSYPFEAPTSAEPAGDESYRQALGRVVTADPQFARTIVNAVWKEFFSRGLVEPADRFDPARLDGDNPPPAPWEVQPSHPRLLEFLTQGFIDNGFRLKWLMKEITSSATYQLSSRYEGTWNPAYEPYFARFQVRRLRAEEIHDALLTSSGVPVPYIVSQTFGVKFFAMEFPDVQDVPLRLRRGDLLTEFAAIATRFLDDFLRGDRDETPRSGEGAIMQALQLMNSELVVGRVAAEESILSALLDEQPDDTLVYLLYVLALSRPPSEQELAQGVSLLAGGDRRKNAEDLLWSLYNKVDFIFNY